MRKGKALIFAMAVLLVIMVFTSCRPRKQRCPAYGQINTEAPCNPKISDNTL